MANSKYASVLLTACWLPAIADDRGPACAFFGGCSFFCSWLSYISCPCCRRRRRRRGRRRRGAPRPHGIRAPTGGCREAPRGITEPPFPREVPRNAPRLHGNPAPTGSAGKRRAASRHPRPHKGPPGNVLRPRGTPVPASRYPRSHRTRGGAPCGPIEALARMEPRGTLRGPLRPRMAQAIPGPS